MAKKEDIKQVDSICKKYRATDEQRWEFGDYIHELKESGTKGSGRRGDFTYAELDYLMKDYLGLIEDGEE